MDRTLTPEQDFVPYKKYSSKKKPPKADHKHYYEPCVFEHNTLKLDKAHGFIPEPTAKIGSFCPVCGKVGGASEEWYETAERYHSVFGRVFSTTYTEAANRELNKETRTLPTFWLDDAFGQKYVSLDGHGGDAT